MGGWVGVHVNQDQPEVWARFVAAAVDWVRGRGLQLPWFAIVHVYMSTWHESVANFLVRIRSTARSAVSL